MKLSPITIILIGVAVGLSALSFAFFWYWTPNRTEAGYYRELRTALDTEIRKRSALERNYDEVEQRKVNLENQWRQIVATRTPGGTLAQGGIDLNVPGWQLTVDARKYRNNVQRAVNAQLLRGGVKVLDPAPFVPEPSDASATILAEYFNYPAYQFPVVVFNLGTVTVQGTYEQIMNHVRSYKNMPRYLAVVHNLALTGTSPTLTATYDLSIVGFIRAKTTFPPVPQDAGGAATASAPGGPGGPGAPGGRGVPGGAGRAGFGRGGADAAG